MDLRGIHKYCKVRVNVEELNYGDEVGVVTDILEQSLDDDFIIKVEFDRGSELFVEYFAPTELDLLPIEQLHRQ